MEKPQIHPYLQPAKPRILTLEGNTWKRSVTEPQYLHGSQQRLRHKRESPAAQRSTIALTCRWIVEHQLGTTSGRSEVRQG